MSLVKSSITIGFFTLISRICGFVRDILIANAIGASWLSDAFFVAFKLPNFFRRLFAEGAFNSAFVPLFAGTLSDNGREAALLFAREVLSVLLFILLLLNAIFIIGMPWILPFFAPGFIDDPEKFDLTVVLSRITFAYILFISLVSLLSGILNSLQRFAAVAATPILLNICLIGALLLAELADTPAHALAFGVLLAGVVQLVWLIIMCMRADALPGLALPKLTSHVRELLKLIAPAALGAGVAQINLLVDVVLASNFDEGVSYLYYADRLNELPIGIIAVAVGTALLPMLSRQIREGNHNAARHSLNRALELVLLFSLPAATALVLIPEPLISVLFQHGEFTAQDTLATYTALIAYGCGLPAFVLVKVFAPGFFANRDTKTPFYIATFCVLVNLVLNLILMQYYAHVGLAMATSIAGWCNAVLMGLILYRRGHFRPDPALRKRLWRMAASSAFMGLIIWNMHHYLVVQFEGTLSERILALCLLVGSGMFSYGACALCLGAVDRTQLRSYFRKNKSVS
ncbi:MAG: murein biosynthesis integral membrane protein MurJ [Rickettsiales bacterium]|nr:murein biosynthesis integral membrane protein MurJ [Rickettsiales bacterium]